MQGSQELEAGLLLQLEQQAWAEERQLAVLLLMVAQLKELLLLARLMVLRVLLLVMDQLAEAGKEVALALMSSRPWE